jgi:hypothetical protein
MSGAGLGYNDRVQESTTTSGTGTITLGGAVAGFQAFSTAFPSPVGGSQDVYYTIVDGSNNWEVGIGTYTSGSDTLSRNTVLQSSNSNALVSFTGSGQTVFCDIPAKSLADRGLTIAMAMHIVPQ